jgi:aldehyde dehydrogenase (NAD+)
MSTTDFASHNPATGEEIGRFPNLSAAEVHICVEAAHNAAIAWRALGYSGRKKVLRNWASLISIRINEIGHLIATETGKPLSDATLEASLAIEQLAWAANHAEKVLADQKRPSGLLMFNMSAKVQRSPYGVIGVIGPWTYPLFTPMGSIAYALAAGNTVVFKPSEYTPAVGDWLSKSFAEIEPFSGIFTTVTGLPDTGRALTESAVNKISFTGSTRTAKKVAESAAGRMIPVVLECGGKDPVIVAADANIEKAAEYALWSAMANAGQSCIGAERVYVVESIADRFIETITSMAKKLHEGTDYGPSTMPSQLGVIQSHIEDAAAKGAKFALGGLGSVHNGMVSPTIMLDVPEDSTAMTEETFGPTLAINKVSSITEAIELSNASSYGLAAAVFSKSDGDKIASQLQCGMVSINSVFSFAAVAAVPFGGVKDSGYGRIHGHEGLLEFTYPRTIVGMRFPIPLAFTSFKRTKFADAVIKRIINTLYGR